MSASAWRSVQLSDVAAFGSGTTPARARQSDFYKQGTVPWVKTLDLNNGSIFSTDESVTTLAIEQTNLRIHPAESVLVAMYGGFGQIGRTGVLRIRATTNQAITTVLPDHKLLNSDFLLHLLNYRVRYWRSVASSSRKDPNITKSDVKSFPLDLPSLPEQEAIASAINDTSELLSSLERVIAKRRAIKQGMMQELLTSRTRLPGFGKPWSVRTVSELLEFKNGLNKASEFFGRGTPIVNFMDVMRSPIVTSNRVGGRVTLTRDEIKRFSARRGDIFFTRTSETVEEVGTAAVLVDDIMDASFSGFLLRGRPKSNLVNSTFLAYQFQLDTVRKQVTGTASYTTRALTNGRALGRVELLAPSIEEQVAIVDVISDVVGELEALECRLEAARAIKQGMMQELLTGRTRLAPTIVDRAGDIA